MRPIRCGLLGWHLYGTSYDDDVLRQVVCQHCLGAVTYLIPAPTPKTGLGGAAESTAQVGGHQ